MIRLLRQTKGLKKSSGATIAQRIRQRLRLPS